MRQIDMTNFELQLFWKFKMGNVDTNNRTAVLLVTCTHFLDFQKKTTKSQLFQKFSREEVFIENGKGVKSKQYLAHALS